MPARPQQIVLEAIALHCDLCGSEIMQYHKNGSVILNPAFRKVYGTALDVQIKLRAGEKGLDGGVGETTSFDLCPTCFETKLRPWLEQQGAVAKVEPWGL